MSKTTTPAAPTPYELLGQRIQRIVSSPRAMSERTAVISRAPDEAPEDWDRLLEEFETLGHVTLIPQEDGAIRLRWNPEEAM